MVLLPEPVTPRYNPDCFKFNGNDDTREHVGSQIGFSLPPAVIYLPCLWGLTLGKFQRNSSLSYDSKVAEIVWFWDRQGGSGEGVGARAGGEGGRGG